MPKFKEFKRLINNSKLNGFKDFTSSQIGENIIHATCNNIKVFMFCIRDNYVNIYWNGCNILKLNPFARNKYLIHYKYINENDKSLMPSDRNPYVSLNMTPNNDDLTIRDWSFKENIINKAIDGTLINVLNKYTKGEKYLLDQYIKQTQPFAIDLEIAFVRYRSSDEISKSKAGRFSVADRIDLAVLTKENDVPLLKLVEVKIKTDSRLRSIAENIPEVVEQMRIYKDFISAQKNNLLEHYKLIASNYIDLGIEDIIPGINRTLLRQVQSELVISPDPLLLVINNFEKKSHIGREGVDHNKRLNKLLIENGLSEFETWDCFQCT